MPLKFNNNEANYKLVIWGIKNYRPELILFLIFLEQYKEKPSNQKLLLLIAEFLQEKSEYQINTGSEREKALQQINAYRSTPLFLSCWQESNFWSPENHQKICALLTDLVNNNESAVQELEQDYQVYSNQKNQPDKININISTPRPRSSQNYNFKILDSTVETSNSTNNFIENEKSKIIEKFGKTFNLSFLTEKTDTLSPKINVKKL